MSRAARKRRKSCGSSSKPLTNHQTAFARASARTDSRSDPAFAGIDFAAGFGGSAVALGEGGWIYFFGGTTASLHALATRNLTTVFFGIWISSPV